MAATLALFIALGAGIAYAADGDADSCDNVRPADIAAPIEGGKIKAVDLIRGTGGAADPHKIAVDGEGRMVIRNAGIEAGQGTSVLYHLTARPVGDGGGDAVDLEEHVAGSPSLRSVEFAFPVKRGTYTIQIDAVVVREEGGVASLRQLEDWTYQLLPAA